METPLFMHSDVLKPLKVDEASKYEVLWLFTMFLDTGIVYFKDRKIGSGLGAALASQSRAFAYTD